MVYSVAELGWFVVYFVAERGCSFFRVYSVAVRGTFCSRAELIRGIFCSRARLLLALFPITAGSKQQAGQLQGEGGILTGC